MKTINHNIKPTLKSTLIFCSICAVMITIGKVNYNQNQQIKELRQQQEKRIVIQKQDEQRKIDSAIYYVDLNADLGDAMDIKFYINEASNIYNLDSVQIVAVSNEYYLD
jgi:ribosomal protein L30E